MKLNVEISFTDKYTDEDYTIGKVIEVDETRGKELLADSRGLVSLNEAEKVQVEDNVSEDVEAEKVTAKKSVKNKK